MFGSRGKYAANHISASLADQSESEQERERIELTDFKPKKSKHRRARLKSPKSPRFARTKMNFNVIEEPILPDDTVQRVSLRYGVPVSVNCASLNKLELLFLCSAFLNNAHLSYDVIPVIWQFQLHVICMGPAVIHDKQHGASKHGV